MGLTTSLSVELYHFRFSEPGDSEMDREEGADCGAE